MKSTVNSSEKYIKKERLTCAGNASERVAIVLGVALLAVVSDGALDGAVAVPRPVVTLRCRIGAIAL